MQVLYSPILSDRFSSHFDHFKNTLRDGAECLLLFQSQDGLGLLTEQKAKTVQFDAAV